jgi:16S rRNA (cytosine967-C5)-methyltransferase
VYSTSSHFPQENENNSQAIIAANPGFEALDAATILAGLKVAGAVSLCAGGAEGGQYLRLWPQRHATDGFFAAVWQKKESVNAGLNA